MREKVRDLIYLNTENYTSLSKMKKHYWSFIILPFFMLVVGIVAINKDGVSWKSLFPIVSVIIWNVLYWIFVLSIQHRRTKTTFELRFLTNGITGLFISSLFWLFYTSFNLNADNHALGGFDFCLWILFFYLLFSAAYIALTVIGVHKGRYKKVKEKAQSPRAIALNAFFASIIPVSGILGIMTSKLLRSYADVSVQIIVVNISFALVIILLSLGNINFVQYYYCKKYDIHCDEHGDTTSPGLERQIKAKRNKA